MGKINLYFSIVKYDDMPIEMKYLNIVQALETYHARFKYNDLGQFTRNYTQTTKRGLLTTKQAEYQAPGKCEIFSLFCCPGFPKGLSLWHTTLLAKCSVLYALSALLRKCGCHQGGQGHLKRQENRAVIAWRGAASARLVSSADRAYMKTPVLLPMPDFGTKCFELVDILPQKLKWAGSHFRAFPP